MRKFERTRGVAIALEGIDKPPLELVQVVFGCVERQHLRPRLDDELTQLVHQIPNIGCPAIIAE